MPDTELHLEAAPDVVAWRRRQLIETGFQPGWQRASPVTRSSTSMH